MVVPGRILARDNGEYLRSSVRQMVQVRYIGTGEAFDHRMPNTSIVYEGDRRILLDCGYSIPHALWGHSIDPEWLDAIYLTHFHADHCFGLPAVLVRMGQDGRRQPLALLGGVGSARAIQRVLETGFPGMMKRSKFELRFHEIVPSESFELGSVTMQTARSHHSIPNHSIRLTEGNTSVCYSGDGGPSDATELLYTDADLLIHEAYYAEESSKLTHASVPQVIAMAHRVGVKSLHLLHLARAASKPADQIVPVPGQVFTVS